MSTLPLRWVHPNAHYTVHRTRYTLHSTRHTLHSTRYTVHITQYAVHITQDTTHYTAHRTRYTVHITQCKVHSTRYTLHNAQYTVHITQYTVHTNSTTHSPFWNWTRSQLIKKLPTLCGTQWSLTVLTSARHLTLLWGLPSYFSKIHINIILASTLRNFQRYLPFSYRHLSHVCICLLSHPCHMPA